MSFYRFLVGTAVLRRRVGLFFAGDSVFVAKAGPLTCGCSRMFLLVIAVVGDNIATMRDMKVGISERKRVFPVVLRRFVWAVADFVCFVCINRRIGKACTIALLVYLPPTTLDF